jgi:HPt (histidine-containing phosphotransfer) domain-containing protein
MKMDLNISRIEEIVGDDLDMKKMLINMYIETCKKCITELEKSLTLSENAEEIWHNSNHELKGASYNLGFEDLGNYCKKIEKSQFSIDQKLEIIDIYKKAQKSVEDFVKSL